MDVLCNTLYDSMHSDAGEKTAKEVFMLGLGLASSHAPAMFEPKERWPLVYSRIPEYTKASQPHTAKLETPAVIQGYIDRINAAFDVLRQQLDLWPGTHCR
jgi:hypothetical protein